MRAGCSDKSPLRYGTFKDPFNHRMVFVYATAGSAEENQWSFDKARFDAETWYYRANGAVDLVADKDYSWENYEGRNVIIYGNASTNRAWKILLNDCPIQVDKNKITAGEQSFSGNDLAAYFTWPIKRSLLIQLVLLAEQDWRACAQPWAINILQEEVGLQII
jgi:hypothetical protein